MSFVHLHTHSHYSLLDGLPKIDELVNRAKELGMKALALTDHGVMYGLVEFYQKAKKAGLKPILGCEVYIAPHDMHQKRAKIDIKPYHLVLLIKDKEGYKNLIKLTTKAHLEGYYYKPRIDMSLLEKHSKGLIALTGCLDGQVPRAILKGNKKEAEKIALRLNKIFGQGNFFLEIQHHPNIPKQKEVNMAMCELSKKLGIPLVATNDVHYLDRKDAEAQDILLCIQTKKTVKDEKRLSMLSDDFSFKTPQEMIESFKETPSAIENTTKVANMCHFELELGKINLPSFEVPKGETPDTYLKKLCLQGLNRRYGKGIKLEEDEKEKKDLQSDNGTIPHVSSRDTATSFDPKIIERLEYELSVIQKTGFAPYFLIVQDFVNWAKKNDIVVGPGRGSAAGSLVSYLLNITEIDPIKYNLLFERFLNLERISMPDIDLDFADVRRDEVIKYIKKKYGDDHVAQIITFGTMAARAAIRDAGRALGYTYDFCDRIAKLIPMFSGLDESLNTVPELRDAYETDPQAKKLIDVAKKLEGVARHASTHACGVVICKDHIDEYTPRQHPTQDDQSIVTQYEMHAIEDLGLLKMDLLGLKNLTIIQNTLNIIEKTKGVKIDLAKISHKDKKTFELFQKGQTTGVFQMESAGMKRYLKRLRPTKFEDLIAMVALYRPGPMEWISDYIAGKHKQKEIKYIHPKLKPILEETYGVCIYQEQLMRIARDLAGFTLAEADTLRKAVGKKIKSLLLEQRKRFIQGCIANDVPKETAEKLFSYMEPFARYGFNKAHATCYAEIAYQTAYLKAHYPAEFMASCLTAEQENTDQVAKEITECHQMGIKVAPPHINESFDNFTVVDDKTIRFGLTAIKNLGRNLVREIIFERKQRGNFKNLDDFLRRVGSKDLNKKSLEALTKSGALDSLSERNQILQNMDRILRYAKDVRQMQSRGQKDLFERGGLKAPNLGLRLKATDPADKKQRLKWEKEFLGLYVSEHPCQEFKDYLLKKTTPCSELSMIQQEKQITCGGMISAIKRIVTKSKQPMLFVKIEDLTSEIETLVFPSVLKQTADIWQEDKIVQIKGKISLKDNEPKVLVDEAFEITKEIVEKAKTEKTNPHSKKLLELSLPLTVSAQLLPRLKKIFENYKGDTQVNLKIPDRNGNFKNIATDFKVEDSESFIKEIKKLIKNIVIERR